MSLAVPGQLLSKERRHLKQLQEVKVVTEAVIQADDVVFEDGTTVESATSIDAPVTTSTASNTYQYIITDRGITDAVERVSSEHVSVNKSRTESVNESGDGQVITYATDGLPSSDLSWCLMATKGAPNSLTLPDQSTGSFPYANAATPITDESAFLTTNTAIEVRKAGVYEIEANNLWQLDTTTPTTSAYTANTAPDNRVTFDGTTIEGSGYYNVSGELTAGSAPYASGSTGFTFMAWVYRTTSATGQYDRIVDFNNGTGTGGSGILYAASPVVYWWDYPTSGNSGTYTAAAPYDHLSNNTWVHVCITHTSAGVLTDYRDGASVGSIGATYQSASSFTNKWLGKSGFTGQPNFTGQMADVIMLNSALTSTELSTYLSTNTLPTAAEIIMRYPTPATAPAEIATQVCVKRSILATEPMTTASDILSQPWVKVQQVNAGTVQWHQGNDNLQGTQSYSNPTTGFAVQYDTTPFTHFLFAHLDTDGTSARSNGPFVVMTKEEARSLYGAGSGGSGTQKTVKVLYRCTNDSTEVSMNDDVDMLMDITSSGTDNQAPFISAKNWNEAQTTNNIVWLENLDGNQLTSNSGAVHAERGAAVWIINNPNFNIVSVNGPTTIPTTVRDILSEPWMKVQQVNPGTVQWHQGDDNLQGTQLYNTSDGWAIPYNTTPFTHFLFAHLDTDGVSPRSSGPFVVMTKEEARRLTGNAALIGDKDVTALYTCLNGTGQVSSNVTITMLQDLTDSSIDQFAPYICAENYDDAYYNNNVVFAENSEGNQTESDDGAVHAERGAAVWIINNPNFNRYASVGPTSTCLLQEDFPLGSTRVSALTQCAPGDKIGVRAVGLALETAAGPAVTGPAGRCSLRISRVSDHFSGHLSYYSDTPFPTILNSKFIDLTFIAHTLVDSVNYWTRSVNADGSYRGEIRKYSNNTDAAANGSNATPYAGSLLGLRSPGSGTSSTDRCFIEQTLTVKIGHTYEVDITTSYLTSFPGSTLVLTATADGGTMSQSATISYSNSDFKHVFGALTFQPDTTSVKLRIADGGNGEVLVDKVVVRNTTVCVAPLQVYKGLPEGVPLTNYTDTPLIDVQCMPTTYTGQAIHDTSYPTFISGARDYYIKTPGFTPTDVRVSLVMLDNPGQTYTTAAQTTTIVISDTSTSPPTLISNASDYYEVLSGNIWDGLVRFKCGPGLNAHSIMPGISTGAVTETSSDTHLDGTRNNYTGQVGYTFTCASSCVVTKLGRLPPTIGAELQSNQIVTIWRNSDDEIMAQTTVGIGSELFNNYRYEPVASVELVEGVDYTIAGQVVYGQPDLYFGLTGGTFNANLVTNPFGRFRAGSDGQRPTGIPSSVYKWPIVGFAATVIGSNGRPDAWLELYFS